MTPRAWAALLLVVGFSIAPLAAADRPAGDAVLGMGKVKSYGWGCLQPDEVLSGCCADGGPVDLVLLVDLRAGSAEGRLLGRHLNGGHFCGGISFAAGACEGTASGPVACSWASANGVDFRNLTLATDGTFDYHEVSADYWSLPSGWKGVLTRV